MIIGKEAVVQLFDYLINQLFEGSGSFPIRAVSVRGFARASRNNMIAYVATAAIPHQLFLSQPQKTVATAAMIFSACEDCSQGIGGVCVVSYGFVTARTGESPDGPLQKGEGPTNSINSIFCETPRPLNYLTNNGTFRIIDSICQFRD